MQLTEPLTPTLSPSDGEREKTRARLRVFTDWFRRVTEPSDGERVGGEGFVDCMGTALEFTLTRLSVYPALPLVFRESSAWA